MIRALVAEDSTTVRELLVSILSSDDDIEVVGEAKDGLEAVSLTRELRPDVVTMDIHMPGMDGFEATKQIMVEAPTPIVIVSGTLDVREVEVAMYALRIGALGVQPKPPGPSDPAFEEMANEYLQKVKSLSQVKVVRRWADRSAFPPAIIAPPARLEPAARPRIVAIAASTGGPAALYRIVGELPRDFDVPILIVQHIAHGFIDGLASWLNTAASLRVKVAEEGERPVPRTVYLGPDRRHLAIDDAGSITLLDSPPNGGFRPSANVLFDSVARVYGRAALAVILTGMGQDGVEGLATVRRAGGLVIAQNEATSVVFGMPGAAVRRGLPHVTLPVDAIARQLVQTTVNGGRPS